MTNVLQTERLVLRKMIKEDESFLLGMYQNPKVNASYVCDSLKDPEVLHKFVERMVDKEDDGKNFFWVVTVDNQPIGTFNTFISHDDTSTIEIGYAIDSKYWNQNYATEALKEVIQFLWKHTEYHKIQCAYFLYNLASKRVMEKAGMIYEGIRREVFFFRGEYQSCGYYYLIRE